MCPDRDVAFYIDVIPDVPDTGDDLLQFELMLWQNDRFLEGKIDPGLLNVTHFIEHLLDPGGACGAVHTGDGKFYLLRHSLSLSFGMMIV